MLETLQQASAPTRQAVVEQKTHIIHFENSCLTGRMYVVWQTSVSTVWTLAAAVLVALAVHSLREVGASRV